MNSRTRCLAALSLVSTAGLLGTYLGNPRMPRAYASQTAPFASMFSPLTIPAPPRSLAPAARIAPACDISVDDSVTLHAAVVNSVDDSVICLTGDIPDLDAELVIDDTSLTLVGAGGLDGLGNVTLTAINNRHIRASFPNGGTLRVENLTLEDGVAGGGQNGGSIWMAGAAGQDTRVYCTDDSFIGNEADRGGALYLADVKSAEVRGSVLTDDSAIYGGAIHISSVGRTADTDFRLYDTLFENNRASVHGGAIAVHDRTTTATSADTFYVRILGTNTAPVIFDNNRAYHGGGGGIWMSEQGPGTAVIESFGSVDFVGNYSTVTGYALHGGGAISAYSDVATTAEATAYPTVLAMGEVGPWTGHTSFSHNAALVGGGYGSGGAVYVRGSLDAGGWTLAGGAQPQAVGPTFTRNAAFFGGGAFVKGWAFTYHASFIHNYALFGGGLTVFGGPNNPHVIGSTTSYLKDSYFADQPAGGAYGSGIAVAILATGEVTVSGSTFLGNASSGVGAAIALQDDTSSTILNSTFVNNTSDDSGGAVYSNRPLTIDFSTFTGNYAGATAGAIYAQDSVTISNSIVQGNLSPGITDVVSLASVLDSFSLFTSPTSVIDAGSWAPGAGSIVSSSSVLGPLQDNGGFVVGDDTVIPTMMPIAGSPAIDSANPSTAGFPASDQRGAGFPRVSGPRADMGAVERTAPPAPPPAPTPASAPRNLTAVAGDHSAVITWEAPSSAGSFPITDYRITATPSDGTCLVKAPATTCTITGLTNGVTYTFTAQALTGAGWSTTSAPSNPVTPEPAPVDKSIVITGTRGNIGKRPAVFVTGTTTGLIGNTVRARIKFPGQTTYTDGSTRTINDRGQFDWQRKTGKKIYVYFVTDDGAIRSNRLIIDK